MSKPTLTVFTPNYNHGDCVARALESVITQSRPPDQYLVVDDGSTDNSLEVIRPYLQRCPPIELIVAAHGGLWAALDLALAKADGDYFFGLAADDELLPGFLEQAMGMAERHPQAGIVFGRLQCCDLDGRVAWTQELPPNLSMHDEVYLAPERFLHDYLAQQEPTNSAAPATIYRLAALREVGFRRELDAWCDTFAVWAIGAKYGACAVNRLATSFRQGSPTSVSGGWFNDFARSLGGITRAAQLMLSPDFRGRFPPEFVRRWHAAYLGALLRAQPDQWLHQVEAAIGSLPVPRGVRRPAAFRFQRWLLRRLLPLHARTRLRLLERHYRDAVASQSDPGPQR